ncbi:hypothetical protein SFR_2395 [Streptomyces sp. FR-008]|nr:hypothetical protein SFR_2395 [Streptomyces sp. FR-008]
MRSLLIRWVRRPPGAPILVGVVSRGLRSGACGSGGPAGLRTRPGDCSAHRTGPGSPGDRRPPGGPRGNGPVRAPSGHRRSKPFPDVPVHCSAAPPGASRTSTPTPMATHASGPAVPRTAQVPPRPARASGRSRPAPLRSLRAVSPFLLGFHPRGNVAVVRWPGQRGPLRPIGLSRRTGRAHFAGSQRRGRLRRAP